MGAKVEGVTKLRANIKDLLAGVNRDTSLSSGQKSALVRRAHEKITATLSRSAGIIKNRAQSKARAQGWPNRTIGTFFTYADVAGQRPNRTRALAGIRTGAPPRKDGLIYKEWRAASTKSPRAKRPLGTLLGMSLASMYEHGTTKQEPRPAFRPAVTESRAEVRAELIKGYREVITGFDWGKE